MNNDDFESFKLGSKAIGAELAQRNHVLSIGSLGENTADFWVATGFSEAGVEGTTIVLLYRLDEEVSTKVAVDAFNSTHTIHIEAAPSKGTHHARHIEALSKSQAVLLLGGRRGTSTTGYSSSVLRKPVLSVPAFGGAAEEIWNALQFVYGRSTLKDDRLSLLSRSEWTHGAEKTIVDSLVSLVRSNPFADNLSRSQWAFNCLSFTSISLWFFAFFYIPLSKEFSFFLCMMLSSLIGTCLRTIIRVYFHFEELFSPTRIVSDFMVGLVASFAFFLIYLIGGSIYGKTPGDLLEGAQFKQSIVLVSAVSLTVSFLLERAIPGLTERLSYYIDNARDPNA